MRNLFLLICIIGIFIACSSDSNSNQISENQSINTQELNTVDKQKAFLEEIYEVDSRVHSSNSFQSELTINEVIALNRSTDSLNLVKVENYLKVYGYPKKSEVGENAALAPLNVIHRADISKRKSNFKYIYKAYLDKDIDKASFTLFLERMYQIEFQQKFQILLPFVEEDRIRLLMKELGLK